MINSGDERQIRIEKINKMRTEGVNPYCEKASRTHTLEQARSLELGTKDIELYGRMMLKRIFGKLVFATLQDITGRMQIALSANDIDAANFKFFQKMVDVGDFVWVKGELFKTEKGEITLRACEFRLLSKAIHPLPEKFHGVTDLETRSRQRYLDLLMNDETMERFRKRIKTIKTMRNFLEDNGFMEVETPVLQAKPSGALAKPFKTHHNALDVDLFMRIAPETYLKRCIAGGFEKVFEFARCFRNEGMDPSHLQEFTLLEFYSAYWNYEDSMDFTERLIKHILMEVNGSLTLQYGGKTIDFSGEWPRYSFRQLILEHAGIDIDQCKDRDSLVNAIKSKNITLEDVDFNRIGRGNLIDQLYKKVARPGMIKPQFLIHHPIDLSPLARKNDNDPMITDRFQLVVNSWEVVNAYSELVDPIDQRERLLKQAQAREGGDEEAMIMEEDFIQCMEYGMPPISGWGMGIDRFTALLTDQENLREVVLFPLMKSWDGSDSAKTEEDGVDESFENKKSTVEKSSDAGGILLPEDIKELGAKPEDLDKLFAEKIKSENLIHHSIASAAVLAGIAKKFGLNETNYYYLGLMHDIDFDEVKDMSLHARTGAEWLKKAGMNDYALNAVMSHNEEGTGVKRETFADFALTCAESVTGLIFATAKVYPDKKVASVKVKSVTKRMKEKSFAAKVSRENIMLCGRIGLTLDEFVDIAIEAMIEAADRIGV